MTPTLQVGRLIWGQPAGKARRGRVGRPLSRGSVLGPPTLNTGHYCMDICMDIYIYLYFIGLCKCLLTSESCICFHPPLTKGPGTCEGKGAQTAWLGPLLDDST